MIESQEANETAQEALESYINSCDCKTLEEVSQILITMLATVGASLNATQGQYRTVKAFELFAGQLGKAEYATVARISRVN